MKTVRIGNGCGFWGDNLDAPILLAEHGELDYLTLEYLAELTMSILALQKQRNPTAGFATDFLDVLERLGPTLRRQPHLKIITNAGGMNPAGCAAQARAILDKAGLSARRLAVVSGDDLLPRLDSLLAAGHPLTNLDTGEPLTTVRPCLVSANAYLGSRPIVEALQQGASIVITGRVADACLTVAPAVHEFGWSWEDWGRLGAATAAGHLIECGAQVTGGLWCNWQELDDLAHVGYPIAAVGEDGAFVITKPAGTGGAVNRETVTEQLLYELGDPAAYLTPDVTADFTALTLTENGRDRVLLTGGRGHPTTDSYKVSAAYRDGFAASGTLVVAGPHAAFKARRCGDILLERLRRIGVEPQHHHVECLGAGACVPLHPLTPDPSPPKRGRGEKSGACVPLHPLNADPSVTMPGRGVDAPEVVLRVAVRDARKAVVERFTKEFAPLVTSGPPGITGYTTGRPVVREVFAYWPALIAKSAVAAQVEIVP